MSDIRRARTLFIGIPLAVLMASGPNRHLTAQAPAGNAPTGAAVLVTLGADGVWLGTRFTATPEARTVAGYKDALLRAHEDDTVISRGFTGKTLRAIRNEWTQHIEEHPEELSKFPEQMGKAVAANALHLGGDEKTPVDPNKECYPSGQGVGAIDTLIPAGDLVRQIVDVAEHALARAARTVVR